MKKLFLLISFASMVAAGFSVVYLSTIPFGTFFKTSFIILVIATILTLIQVSIRFLQSKMVWKKLFAIPFIFLFLITILIGLTLAMNNANSYTFLANSILSIVPEKSKGAFVKFPNSVTKEEWKKDLEYLKEELPKHHANPFLYTSQTDFTSAIASLESDLINLNDKEIAFEICRIVSTLQDGHTQLISIVFDMPPFLESRLFPLRIFYFNDGIYVTNGGRDNVELEGLRITKIGNAKIEDILKEINNYIPGENDYYKKQWSFPYLLNAELLKYKKIISNSNQAEFTFIDLNGKEVKKQLTAILSPLYLKWFRGTLPDDDVSRKNRLNNNYWYEYIDSTKTVFLQLNQIANQKGEVTLKGFAKQLNDFIDKNNIDKFVIDIRNCNGGDNTLMSPLINLISNSPKINKQGTLVTLIGRQTFSAGISFISAIQRNTKSIFVGEPAGSSPNQCGDIQPFVLPNSKLLIQVSSKFHQQSFYKDRSLTILPSVNVTYTYQNWKQGIDPAMKSVHEIKANPSIDSFKLDSLKYADYIGRFWVDKEKILTVTKAKNGLQYEIRDYLVFSKGSLNPTSETTFKDESSLVTFHFRNKTNYKFQNIILNYAGIVDTLLKLGEHDLSSSELLMQGKIDESVKMYRHGKAEGFFYPSTTEAELNRYGYKYSAENKLDEAIKLFTLNTELFPASGNTWDSLAEAWLKKGDKIKAKLFYKKSLELNPDNNGAKTALNRL